jgi:phospholipid/cholesterol/gamma-HCH transport system substrate-binding protein
MSSGRLEIRVGLFVIVLLGLAAVMSIKFSKTGFGRASTYTVELRTEDVGTVIENSPVMMSGVKVGYVDDIKLDDNGSVALTVELFSEYDKIDASAIFQIKSSGFLGDQYITVIPPAFTERLNKPLQEGSVMNCEPPFDIMSVARDAQVTLGHAQQLILNVSDRVRDLNATIVNLNDNIFNQETLSDFRTTITNLANASTNLVKFSRSATNVANRVESILTPKTATKLTDSIAEFNSSMANLNAFSHLLRTNAPAVSQSVANFANITTRLRVSTEELDKYISSKKPEVDQALKNIAAFTVKLDKTTEELQSTLSNNRTNITKVIKNISAATENLKGITENGDKIIKGLEAGEGLAGGLLKNEQMHVKFQTIITNLDTSTKHLSTLISNLSSGGLFFKGPKPGDKPLMIPKSIRPK